MSEREIITFGRLGEMEAALKAALSRSTDAAGAVQHLEASSHWIGIDDRTGNATLEFRNALNGVLVQTLKETHIQSAVTKKQNATDALTALLHPNPADKVFTSLALLMDVTLHYALLTRWGGKGGEIASAHAGKREPVIVEPKFVMQLLSDWFDYETIPACEVIFEIVEQREAQFKALGSPNPMLRLCNNLMKRLSKATHTMFSGRILGFLTRFTKVDERSALNMKGDFNKDNLTYLEDATGEPTPAAAQGRMAVDEDSAVDISKVNNDSLDAIYNTLWGLQEVFRDPSVLQTDADKWRSFTDNVETTLNAFESTEIVASSFSSTISASSSSAAPSPTDPASAATSSPSDSKSFSYFPKYLTGRSLLSLQMSDPTLRRQVLSQLIFLIAALTFPSKGMSDSFITDAHRAKMKELLARANKLLDSIYGGKEGELFRRFVYHIVNRDINWVEWKKKACFAIEKEVEDSFETKEIVIPDEGMGKIKKGIEKRRMQLATFLTETGISDDEAKARVPLDGSLFMGSVELARLWMTIPETADEIARAEQTRWTQADVEDLLETVREEEGDATLTEDEKSKNTPIFSFRFMRTMLKRNIAKVSAAKGSIENFVDVVRSEELPTTTDVSLSSSSSSSQADGALSMEEEGGDAGGISVPDDMRAKKRLKTE